MSLSGVVFEKVAGAFGQLLLVELRRIATALEVHVNLQLAERGRQPLFAEPEPVTPHALHRVSPSEISNIAHASPGEQGDPDWLRLDLIEQLARDHYLPIDDETDLLALAREHGWIDREGKLTQLPKSWHHAEGDR